MQLRLFAAVAFLSGAVAHAQQIPVITWSPGQLGVGVPLSGIQLDASANTAGSFTYAPTLGTAFSTVGPVQVTATFTPTYSSYSSTATTATVNVVSAPTTQPTPTGSLYSFTTLAGATGTASAGLFKQPHGLTVDSSGNVYVADYSNFVVWKVTPAGLVTTFAGQAGKYGHADGAGSSALFGTVNAVAADPLGNIYVAESGDPNYLPLREISPDGTVSTVSSVSIGSSFELFGLAVDFGGDVYLSLVGGLNVNDILCLTPGSAANVLAGSLNASAGYVDATGSAARFNFPNGMAVDSSLNVYVADINNQLIRKIAPGGVVTTLAGQSGVKGSSDGTGTAAQFNSPEAVACDGDGNVYVADTGNATIRMITPAGVVTTIGGTAGTSGNVNGMGANAAFGRPVGIAVDTAGNVYVLDQGYDTVRVGAIVPGLQIATQPVSKTITYGASVAFSVAASGSPTYQWEVSTNNGASFSNLSDGAGITGSETTTLRLASPTVSESGYEYQLVATNAGGSVTSNPATLTVNPAGTYSVASPADLMSALSTIDTTTSPASSIINFTGSVSLTSSTTLPAINTTGSVTINGGGYTLDGGGHQRAFFVYAGSVAINNLTIQNTQAQGGSGGYSGGGGGGFGGALFVANGASATLSNVTLSENEATGGGGGNGNSGAGGGGGIGGNGGSGVAGGGGGGIGSISFGYGGSGGSTQNGGNGASGIVTNAASAGNGLSANPNYSAGLGGTNGGGGGAGASLGQGGGGGIGGSVPPGGSNLVAGAGGYGGGGGGSIDTPAGNGGFGGGGGGGGNTNGQGVTISIAGGKGGFGGGGGGEVGTGYSSSVPVGSGGFGAGNGGLGGNSGNENGGGGGGLGAGGSIFVQSGGNLGLVGPLTITGGSAAAGQAGTGSNGGTNGTAGFAFGSGIFLQGSDQIDGGVGSLTLSPAAGQIQTIADVIADQTGSGGTGSNAGSWSVLVNGAGTVILDSANTYSGDTIVDSGTLLVDNVRGSATGTGEVAVESGGTLGGSGTVGGILSIIAGSEIVPGSGGTGTLTVAAYTIWYGANGNMPSAKFTLGSSSGVSTQLALDEAFFNYSAGGTFLIDFGGTGSPGQTYTLITFGETTFSASDFRYTGLPSGLSGTFAIVGGSQLEFTVSQPANPSITAQPAAATVVAGANATFTVAATGSPTFQWQLSTDGGSTFTNLADGGDISGSTTGALTISGASSTQNGYAYRVAITNTDGTTDSNSALLTVYAPLTITSLSTAVAVQNTTFYFSPSFTGGLAPYTITGSGTLPAGIQYFPGPAAAIAGNSTSLGTATFTFVVTDSLGHSATLPLTITTSVIGITSAQSPPAVYGSFFQYFMDAAGGQAPYTYSMTGALPPGLSFYSGGIINGTPTALGTYDATLTVQDSAGNSSTLPLQITVSPLGITSAYAPWAIQNVPYTYQMTAAGVNSAFTYTLGGGIPPGLAFDATTGTISGTPTVVGEYNLRMTVSDLAGNSQTIDLVILVNAFGVDNPTVVNCAVGTPLNYQIPAGGGSGGLTFSCQGLPYWLTLNTSTGVLTGTPPDVYSYPALELYVTDSAGTEAGGELEINVLRASPQLTWAPPASIVYDTALSASQLDAATTITGTFSYSPALGTVLAPGSHTLTATFTPTDTADYSTATAQVPITVNLTAPTITSSLSQSTKVGSAFDYQIAASELPTTYTVTGLPSPSVFDSSSGQISWSPMNPGVYNLTITAANTIGTATSTLVVTVGPSAAVPVLSSSARANGQVGVPFTYGIAASGNPASFAMSSGALPPGLSLSSTTGAISGTPTLAGYYSLALLAANAAGSSQAFALEISIAPGAAAPSITSPASATGTVGTAFSYQIAASSSGASFAASNLPPGLTLNATTGLISGVPQSPGSAAVVVMATNSSHAGSQMTLVVTIQPNGQAPSITSSVAAFGVQGVYFSYTATASNSPTSFAAPNLPPGLSIDPGNGIISGVPTATGTTLVLVTASNSAAQSTAANLAITIAPAPAAPSVVSGNTAAAMVGSIFDFQAQTSPAATSFTMSGAPGWLQINSSTGRLFGVPTGAPGVYAVTLTPSNAAGTGNPVILTIYVAPASGTPVVTSTSSPAAGTAGTPYPDTPTGSLYQTSVTPATGVQYILESGSLPAGLILDAATGYIYGTPTVPGTYTVSLAAANAIGIGASTPVTLTIAAEAGTPEITNSGSTHASALARGGIAAEDTPAATGAVGSAFSYQITATGDPTSFAAANLPAGLAVNPSTGLITGVPAAAGTTTVVISANNGIGVGASTDLVVTIDPPVSAPAISSSPTASATAGSAFSYQVTASNGPTSYNASELPSGLALNPTGGLINGTPTEPGVYSVPLSANNASGTGPVEILTITVASAAGAPGINSIDTVAGTVGSAFATYQVTASNGPIASYSALNLPAGLFIDPVNGAITGTPTTAGTYTATLTAANAVGPSSPYPLEVTIAPAATSSSVTSAATAGSTAGAAFSYQIAASNAPISYNVTGLPAGLSVNTTTGLITGTVANAGSYPVTISVNNATGTGATSTLTISVINPGSYVRLVNLSARAFVNTGSNILIAGFGISGSGTKQLLLRGVGPGMGTTFPTIIADPLANAQLGLYDSGAPGIPPRLISSNNGWENNPVAGSSPVAAIVTDTTTTIMTGLGAFSLLPNSLDSAADVTMPVGNYSTEITGLGANPTGVALAEIYDAESGIPTARLVNISARAEVGTGFNVLIAGFVIAGNTSETVLIRGVGPQLGLPPFNLGGILANPLLQLFDQPGNLIAANSGWSTTPTTGNSPVVALVNPATTAVMNTVGAFSLVPGSNDAAMQVALPPGNYTAQLSGVGGTVGIGLIEVYEVP